MASRHRRRRRRAVRLRERLRAPRRLRVTGSAASARRTPGCLSRATSRGAPARGLRERERLGANPFRLGFVASTDTHNGTSGYVAEDALRRGNQGRRRGDHGGAPGRRYRRRRPGERPGRPRRRVGRGELARRDLRRAPSPRDLRHQRAPHRRGLFAGYGLPSGVVRRPGHGWRRHMRAAWRWAACSGAPPPAGPAAPSILVRALAIRVRARAIRRAAARAAPDREEDGIAGARRTSRCNDVAAGVDPAAVVDPATLHRDGPRCGPAVRGVDRPASIPPSTLVLRPRPARTDLPLERVGANGCACPSRGPRRATTERPAHRAGAGSDVRRSGTSPEGS